MYKINIFNWRTFNDATYFYWHKTISLKHRASIFGVRGINFKLLHYWPVLYSITQCTHLQSPSGIISRTLLAAENTSKLPSFPIPDGIPSKSNLLSSTWSLRKFCSLHNDAGSTVNLFRDKFKLSNFCQISIAKINIHLYYLLHFITKLIIL